MKDRHKSEWLDQFIQSRVLIIFKDDKEQQGVLHRGKKGYWLTTDTSVHPFYKSHVKHLIPLIPFKRSEI